jgi:hypothetical protein
VGVAKAYSPEKRRPGGSLNSDGSDDRYRAHFRKFTFLDSALLVALIFLGAIHERRRDNYSSVGMIAVPWGTDPVPFADDFASNSLLISTGVALIAVFLGLHQWYEWRARERELSEIDRRYFVRQDVRRGVGVAVMLVLAVGLYFGSRIPPKVAGRANLTFIEVWLAIVALIIVMLLLAFVDWVAIRLYARRQSRSIARERLQILRETLRRSPGEHSSDEEPRPD